MAGSVNKVTLVGNLGADPDVKRLSNGDQLVNLSVATSESWRDKNSGERREKTEWHRVVIFNENLGKVAEQYLKKGMKVYLEGQLQTRSWDDQQSGQKRYSTEIVLQRYRGDLQMLDRGEGGGGGGGGQRGGDDRGSSFGQSGPMDGGYGGSEIDDDIPF